MSLLEQHNLSLLEPQVWQQCVVNAVEVNPVQTRQDVTNALGCLAANNLAGIKLPERDRDLLDRKYIGAYRLNDAQAQDDKDELLKWLGIDGSYLTQSQSFVSTMKTLRDNLEVIKTSEPIVIVERRDIVPFRHAGMSVVSVLFSLATLNSSDEHSAVPDLEHALPVGELVAFKKVNFEKDSVNPN